MGKLTENWDIALSGSITRIPTDNVAVYAFSIDGEVTKNDISRMARLMNRAFDTVDKARMLLRFRPYEGQTIGSLLDLDALKAEFRSLAHVEKYAVVGLPAHLASFIDLMDHVIPVDAETFDADEEDEAWAFVGATPISNQTPPP